VVERDRFRHLESVTDVSSFLNTTLKEWIRKMPPEKRELVVDALYEVITSTNAETLSDLSENRIGNVLKVLGSFRGLDNETKKLLSEAFLSLASSAKKTLVGSLSKK